MADVDDVHNRSGRVKREYHNLETADIPDADRAAIEAFANHRQFNEEVASSTLVSDMATLKRSAERAHKPLVDFEGADDTNRILKTNRVDFEVSESSNRNYSRALRVFFRWLDGNPAHDSYEWWESVEIPHQPVEPLDPKALLTVDEVRELRQASDHPRETAFVEFLADTGLRITAALQLKRGGIDGLDSPNPTATPNSDGLGQKGIDPLPLPIIQSQPHLRVWLNQYHPEDHPEAPVFCVKDYFHRDRSNTAMSTSRARDQLKELADLAGLDRSRIHPHAFRHVATTRMRRDMGMDWTDIGHRTGWSENTLSRMKQLYGHLSQEDKNERVFAAAGRAPAPGEDDEPVFVTCESCRREISADARFCPDCGADQEAEYLDARVRRLLSRLEGETAERLNEQLDLLDADPEGRSKFREPTG